MQQKSAAWWQTLTGASVEWRYGVDLLAADEATPLENVTLADLFAADRLVEGSATVTLDVTAPTRRSCQLTLRTTDGRYLPGIASFPSGGAGSPKATGLTWYTVRYRPWFDLLTGFDSKGNKIYDRTYLGIFVLVTPEVFAKVEGATVQLTLLDKSALLQKPFRVTATSLPTYVANSVTVGGYPKGQAIDAVMSDLATRGGIPATRQLFHPAPGVTLPADFPVAEGDEWWTHLAALANSLAHLLFFDTTGNLVRTPSPLGLNAPSLWTVAPGVAAITAAVDRTTNLINTYNHVVVVGASSSTATVRGDAQVTDPSNPYHKQQIGERTVYWGANGLGDMTPDPTITTAAAAKTRAQQLLAEHLGQQETAVLTGRNVPVLDGYDRITVAVPQSGLNLDLFVSQIQWNLAHGGMTATLARWFAIGS